VSASSQLPAAPRTCLLQAPPKCGSRAERRPPSRLQPQGAAAAALMAACAAGGVTVVAASCHNHLLSSTVLATPLQPAYVALDGSTTRDATAPLLALTGRWVAGHWLRRQAAHVAEPVPPQLAWCHHCARVGAARRTFGQNTTGPSGPHNNDKVVEGHQRGRGQHGV
jgi:hypothetical protein